jgi:hypothetical protein
MWRPMTVAIQMIYHVLTPYSKPQLASTLSDYVKGQ